MLIRALVTLASLLLPLSLAAPGCKKAEAPASPPAAAPATAPATGAHPPGHMTAEDYTCPMHPEVHGKAGDKCPKCGMALVPRKDVEAKKAAGAAPPR